MLEKLALLKDASALARYSEARNRTIGENIANADTPGYQARDLEPFTVEASTSGAMRSTRAGHMTPEGRAGGGFSVQVATVGDVLSANGNSVSLEDQMLRSADAQRQHELATTVYRKAMDILRLSVSNR